MSAPEQQQPGGEPNKEKHQQFIRAASYEQERLAARAYFEVQAVVFKNDCDLSVYRFKLRQVSHVAVLGTTPSPDLQGNIETIMAAGTPATLPSDIAATLFERRSQAKKIGPWVEGHYRPGRPF
jgi:hypothetical protein